MRRREKQAQVEKHSLPQFTTHSTPCLLDAALHNQVSSMFQCRAGLGCTARSEHGCHYIIFLEMKYPAHILFKKNRLVKKTALTNGSQTSELILDADQSIINLFGVDVVEGDIVASSGKHLKAKREKKKKTVGREEGKKS